MTPRVFQLHSTVELPLETLLEFLEDPPLPEGIDGVELTRQDDTLVISAIAPAGSVEEYTPTAQLKGTVTETSVPAQESQPTSPEAAGRPRWGGEVEMEQPTKLVEMAAFKGDRDAILQNAALQYPMFEFFCELARQSTGGALSAIVGDDETLVATRIVEGEDRHASIQIVEERTVDESSARGVNWRDNEYIS